MLALFKQLIGLIDVPLNIAQLRGKLQRRDSHPQQTGS